MHPARHRRCGTAAATRRRSRWCASSTSRPTSTARARGLLPPGDPHHFNRTRRMAFDKADVIVIVGTPFDFRMGYGRRLGRGADAGADRSGLPHGRQEPRHLARPGRPSGRDPGRGARRRPRAAPTIARRAGSAWMEELQDAEAEGDRQADAAVHLRELADPSLPGRLGDQRVPDRGHGLHRRRRRRGDDQRAGGAAAPARPLDGPRRARRARHRHRLRASPPSSPIPPRRCCATTATARSA